MGTGDRKRPWRLVLVVGMTSLAALVAVLAGLRWATGSRVGPQSLPLVLNNAVQGEGGIVASVGNSGGYEAGWLFVESPHTSYHHQVDGIVSSTDLVEIWESGLPQGVRLHCDPAVDPRVTREDWIDPWGSGQDPEFICQVMARPRVLGPEIEIGVVTAREVDTGPGKYLNVTMVFSRSRNGL